MQNENGALRFIHHEAAGGIILLSAAIVALLIANSAASSVYTDLLDTKLSIGAGALTLDKSLLHWINDGLMVIFFFLVGLEIKRELMVGELSSRDRAVLPAIAAFGGMVVPGFIYVYINAGDDSALRGWAIPCATDIAFAVSVLALLGSRIPLALKIFLLAVAILDDLGAIIIIALFYTSSLSLTALALAAVGIAALAVLNFSGVTRIAAYVLTGLFIWVCVLKSGVHATLAGVITAFAIPLTTERNGEESPLEKLEESLHPWVTFGVLPLFAFANAGVSLTGVTLERLFDPVPLGILLGLFVGKPIGIFAFTWLAVILGLGSRPQGTTWAQILGVGMVAGIGFTMSLFIGMLAFPEPERAADIRIGVLTGSLLSALAGYAMLARAGKTSVAQKA